MPSETKRLPCRTLIPCAPLPHASIRDLILDKAWEEKAAELDADHLDKWREEVATSLTASAWGGSSSPLDQVRVLNKVYFSIDKDSFRGVTKMIVLLVRVNASTIYQEITAVRAGLVCSRADLHIPRISVATGCFLCGACLYAARLATPARDSPHGNGAGERVDPHADAAPNRPKKLPQRHHGGAKKGKAEQEKPARHRVILPYVNRQPVYSFAWLSAQPPKSLHLVWSYAGVPYTYTSRLHLAHSNPPLGVKPPPFSVPGGGHLT